MKPSTPFCYARRPVRRLVGVVGMSLLGLLQAAQGADWACALAPKGLEDQVEQRRKPLQLPDELDNCEGVRVVSGAVVACTADKRQRPVCREFSQGQMLDRQRFGSHGALSMLAAISDLLHGSPSMQGALIRGPAPVLLPSGIILLPEGKLHLPAVDAAGAKIEIHEGTADGPLIPTASSQGPTRTVALTSLKPGSNYWVVTVGKTAPPDAANSFKFARSADRANALHELKRIDEDKDATPAAKAWMKALWLKSRGYEFDAKLALEAGE